MYCMDKKAFKILMVEHEISSISQLSDMTKINRNTLGTVINGDEQPTSNVIVALAEVFKMTSEQIGLIFFAQNITADAKE